MRDIALSCLAGTAADAEQQQRQQSGQQRLQKYVAAEMKVAAYCFGNRSAVKALNGMSVVALDALTQSQLTPNASTWFSQRLLLVQQD